MFSKRFFYLIFVLLLVIFLSHPAIAAKCVKPNGTGGCYDNIQEAVDNVASGGTVKVYPGIYYGGFDTDKAGITILGMGKKRTDVRIDLGGPSPGNVIIRAANITIKNLTIQNGDNAVWVMSTGFKILNVNIFKSISYGVLVSGGDNVLIKNCKIFSSINHGVYTSGDRLTVQNTIIFDCGASGIYCIGDQLTVEMCTIAIVGEDLIHVEASNATIHNNQLLEAGRHGIFGISDFVKVTENVVRGTGNFGIHIDGEAPVVKKNTVMHCGSRGIILSITGGDSKVVNNQSSYNRSTGFSISAALSSSSVLFKKNKALYNYGTGFNFHGFGDEMIIENQAKNNYGFGFYTDANSTLENNIASENVGSGFWFESNNTAIKNKALNNMTQGFFVPGDDNLLRNNRAIGNLESGIFVSGDNNDIINNTMLDSYDDKCDRGTNNTWTGNTYDTECP